ncbi:efflux RND transporter periplasmic adaptor subunit [Alcanivorax sp. IO_7]|nr:efflux RND transporter periplasmic adaptor subunit [Alcanivorax sp. IO_7]
MVTAEVTEQPRDRSTEFVARVRAIEAVDVRARVEGVIDQVNFTGGERVEEGDLLFALDRRRYEAALAAAEAGLARARASRDNARQSHERIATLARRGTVSRASLDEAQATLRVAEAEVETAQAQVRAARLDLADTRLPSPITGQVSAPALTRAIWPGPVPGRWPGWCGPTRSMWRSICPRARWCRCGSATGPWTTWTRPRCPCACGCPMTASIRSAANWPWWATRSIRAPACSASWPASTTRTACWSPAST